MECFDGKRGLIPTSVVCVRTFRRVPAEVGASAFIPCGEVLRRVFREHSRNEKSYQRRAMTRSEVNCSLHVVRGTIEVWSFINEHAVVYEFNVSGVESMIR